eukprot:TRINITY_DN3910_c0_g1_i1.p1 TRINITY_DN3910_c0_g1~~TRINITY_DN3910_c0_g1_i1.p1  ORF type:complete len:108 (+),score=21.61 TRINITY_DN3910_c0_g1_i1:151-474(+)
MNDPNSPRNSCFVVAVVVVEVEVVLSSLDYCLNLHYYSFSALNKKVQCEPKNIQCRELNRVGLVMIKRERRRRRRVLVLLTPPYSALIPLLQIASNSSTLVPKSLGL